jgi:hypothetical protein
MDFVKWARGVGALVWHTPNQKAYKNWDYMKKMGCHAGIPDIFVIHKGVHFAFEFKAENQVATGVQRAVLHRLSENEWVTAVVWEAKEAVEIVGEWVPSISRLRRAVERGPKLGPS